MRIFVQEFASGGGLVKESLHPALVIEGFGILRALIYSFERIGYNVVTTLDYRLEELRYFLPTEQIKIITEGESVIETSIEILKDCNYFLVVAPGSDSILSNFIEAYSGKKAKSLNCNIEAVNLATKKHLSYKFYSSLGINIPVTFKINENGYCSDVGNEEEKEIHWSKLFEEKMLTFPVIIKPDEGVACEGLFLCSNSKELDAKLKLKNADNLLLQEYIEGEHLSVTAIIRDDNCQIISINKQIISLDVFGSDYVGGVTNITHPLSQEIKKISELILSSISGFNGFIGIDFIIRNNKIYLIEINPRATTPISSLLTQNESIFQVLPILTDTPKNTDRIELSYFEKISIEKSQDKVIPYPELLDLEFILTPPLEISTNKIVALIRGVGKTVEFAQQDFKKNLLNLSNKLK